MDKNIHYCIFSGLGSLQARKKTFIQKTVLEKGAFVSKQKGKKGPIHQVFHISYCVSPYIHIYAESNLLEVSLDLLVAMCEVSDTVLYFRAVLEHHEDREDLCRHLPCKVKQY